MLDVKQVKKKTKNQLVSVSKFIGPHCMTENTVKYNDHDG